MLISRITSGIGKAATYPILSDLVVSPAPTENQDFQNYLVNINEVSFDKFLIIFLTCSYIAYNITFKLKE